MKRLILLLSLVLIGCGKPVADDGISAKECAKDIPGQTRIVFFGESQTEGVISNVQGCKFSYAYVMAESLHMNILNRAIGGSRLLYRSPDNRPSQLEQINSTAFQLTDTVYFMAGYNEALYNGTSLNAVDAFKASLNSAILSMSQQVSKIYIATPVKTFYIQNAEAHALYVSAVEDVVANFPNVTLINSDSALVLTISDFLEDHNHLTPAAQLELAGGLLSEL